MRKVITALALGAMMVVGTASLAMAGEPPANAGTPTCANLGGGAWGNHGDHIKDDYVNPGTPGGAEGGPAHFDHLSEVGPGASFCLEQAKAQSPSTPPGRA